MQLADRILRWAGDVAWFEEHLPSMQEFLDKLVASVHACNPNTPGVEAGRFEIQGHELRGNQLGLQKALSNKE